MITSIFNNTLNILETEFKDDISADDVLDYITDFKENKVYPRKLKKIIIATNARFNFSFKDLQKFDDGKNESIKSYETVMTAIIVANPETAAITSLYESIAASDNYKFNIFSSREAALFWLDSFK